MHSAAIPNHRGRERKKRREPGREKREERERDILKRGLGHQKQITVQLGLEKISFAFSSNP